MKIIDGHVHLDLKKYPDTGVATRALIQDLDKAGIEKAIVMPDGLSCTSVMSRDASMAGAGRLAAFYMPDLASSRVVKDSRDAALTGAYKGFKIHPRNQKVSLDDPVVADVLGVCVDLKMPVFIDCFPFGNLNERNYPLAFDHIAKKFSPLKIIMGHMGGYRVLDALIVARSNKNVFLDLSFTPMYFRGSSVETDVRYVLKMTGPDRCIYGSDYPHMGMKESLDLFIDLAKKAGLGDGDINRITHDNIATLSRI